MAVLIGTPLPPVPSFQVVNWALQGTELSTLPSNTRPTSVSLPAIVSEVHQGTKFIPLHRSSEVVLVGAPLSLGPRVELNFHPTLLRKSSVTHCSTFAGW